MRFVHEEKDDTQAERDDDNMRDDGSSSDDECVDEDDNQNDGSDYDESDVEEESDDSGEDIYIDLDAEVQSNDDAKGRTDNTDDNDNRGVGAAVALVSSAAATVPVAAVPAGRRSTRNAPPPCRFGIDDFNVHANRK